MKTFLILLLSVCNFAEIYNAKLTDRISGGYYVTNNEYSYMARVEATLVCSGFIVNEKLVVSAAHCVDKCTIGHILPGLDTCKVSVGAPNYKSGVTFYIESFHKHPEYNLMDVLKLENNIVVIKLKGTMSFGQTISKISYSLPTDPEILEGSSAIIVGYGIKDSNIIPGDTENLKHATVYITNHNTCVKQLLPYIITDKMICAGAPNVDSCLGDGGGPLVRYYTSGPRVIGIMYRTEHCNDGKSTVATKMKSVSDWLTKTISEQGA